MKSILIVALLVVVAIAQNNPKISDDFSAEAIVDESRGNFKNRFEGILYETFTNKKQRIDVDHVHEHPVHVELLRLFGTHAEYEVQGQDKCRKHALNGTMHAAFSWLANAKMGHECHAQHPNKTIGVSWTLTNEHLRATACVNKADSTIPLWVTYREDAHKVDRRVDFKSFVPGIPDDKYFAVPKNCPS